MDHLVLDRRKKKKKKNNWRWVTGEEERGYTFTSGDFFILDLMKRSKCFWFMQDEWWMWVSTLRTL
jgi:hypothetical protein